MTKWLLRLGWMGVGICSLYAFSMLAGVVSGGALDPPGPVGSTMKSLDDLPPSWHRILASNDGSDGCHSSRFQCVMGDAAVLDRETGLVWEQSPSAAQQNWYSGQRACRNAQTGGRSGWRMPRIEELLSLRDATGTLPAGVFADVQAGAAQYYWSTTVDPANVTNSASVFRVAANYLDIQKQEFVGLYAWCVRGGTYSDIPSDF